jgi:ribosome-binding protein aMBF1 (putative translation factor)
VEYPHELDGVALILVHLPKRVKDEMDRRGLSYRQAAKEIRVSHTFLANVCNKKQEPRSSSIVKLICWLQISSHGESK